MMTTMAKRSTLILGALGLVAATATVTAFVIGSPVSAARPAELTSSSAAPLTALNGKAAYTKGSISGVSATQRYREVTLPAGTRISLRLGNAYSSASSHIEQAVNATVVSSVRANGYTALPAGSRVTGIVSSVERPGRVKGRGEIGLSFRNVVVDGERYALAASYLRVAPATKSTDAKKIGIPAAGGAVVGAILGGKKGALKGALIGGGAGTAVVLSTRGKDAYIGSGSVIGVTLRRALTVRVPL